MTQTYDEKAAACKTPRERLEYLRDFLRTLPDYILGAEVDDVSFNMRNWNDQIGCGTVACIGGWTERLWYDGPEEDASACRLGELLGLDCYQTTQLFFPSTHFEQGESWTGYDATAKQAADVIDNIIETGKVDWLVVRPKA